MAAEQGQTHHTAPVQEKPQAWLEEVRPRAPAGVSQAPELQTLPSSPLQVQSADRFLSCELKEGKQPPVSSAVPRVLQRSPVHSLGEDKNKTVPKKQRTTLRKKIHETHPDEESSQGKRQE